jgi:nucleotide-binding universal stress UspA family protein
MRAVLGYDGSAGGADAAALTGAIGWPPGSSLRVVSVIEPALMMGTPWAPGGSVAAPGLDAQVQAYLEERQADLVEALASPGREVNTVVIHGRPASVIVDEAAATEADLVIIGSRGHGQIASLVLGSVSSEVVDHAPCPVLVARRPTFQRILFATDGSPSALAAGNIVGSWPIFDDARIAVVSVADVEQPWHTGIAPTMYQQVLETYTKDLAEANRAHLAIAEDAAAQLRAAGRSATADVRTGDAATEIIEAAAEWDADAVVIGSRGRTGLTRLVLGSVARNVLHGGQTSVLVVRGESED